MLRHVTAALAIATGAFAPTFILLTPDLADAKYRRVTAVTSCLPDRQQYYHTAQFQNDLYTITNDTVVRGGDGLEVQLQASSFENIGVRCEVPTDSYLPHHTMTEAHISGNKNAGNGFGSYAKACFVWWTNGSYSCTSEHAFASGNFNRVINLGTIWNDGNSFPMITTVLADGDRLYGVYYTDQ